MKKRPLEKPSHLSLASLLHKFFPNLFSGDVDREHFVVVTDELDSFKYYEI